MPLNNSQVLILKSLAKSSSGMTREQLGRTGACAAQYNLGPVYHETLVDGADHSSTSLYELGLVSPEEHESGVLWVITAKGRKMAQRMEPRPVFTSKVPTKLLDAVLQEFIAHRPYSLDSCTTDDLKIIREELGEPYSLRLSLDSLRQQISNRRKSGVFASRKDKISRSAKRVIKEYGLGGTVCKGLLTPKQLKRLNQLIKKEAAND